MRAILIIAAVILPGLGLAQKNFLDQNYIEVQGKATVKVVPDQIYLRIQISEKQKYRADMEAKERNMLKDLKDLEIPSSDIVIKDLASNFRSRVFSDDNIVISKVYLLLVHDGKTANKVISSLEELEISNIKVDHLDHTKMPEFKKEASLKAMVAAKTKAESMATSIGQSIGRALYIEELNNEIPGQAYDNTRLAFKGEVSTSPGFLISDLDFDEIKIEYSVQAKFELK
ncbi:MAG: SIMPL domain-containing protein [Bacteroidota bacterium]